MNTIIPAILEALFFATVAWDVILTNRGLGLKGITEDEKRNLNPFLGESPRPVTVWLFWFVLCAGHGYAVFRMVDASAPLAFSVLIIGASIAWRGRAVLHNRAVLRRHKARRV